MSEYTDGLRAAAEWFDNHPEYQLDYTTFYLQAPGGHYDASGNYHEAAQEESVAWLKAVTQAFGECKKRPSQGSYGVVKQMGGGVRINATSYSACKKIPKGSHTEIVEEPIETTTRTKKVTKVVEDFEYECPKSLLS